MTKQVVIVDYGVGNLLNVIRSFEHIGASVKVVDTPEFIGSADRLVLPGVGAFRNGMAELQRRGFSDAIKDYVDSNRPLFGICLGMQMMLECSEEFGYCDGLGLIAGKVVAIPASGIDGEVHKIPHIGWNELLHAELKWSDSLLNKNKSNDSVYFVHSYMVEPNDNHIRLADCDYDGQRICAVIQKDNVMGCQFHPEKSGRVGLTILSAFLDV